MATFCILLGAPRSGTTMLGDAVSRSFDAAWPQEIFHAEHADPTIDFRVATDIKQRCNFFNFRHEIFRQRPELSYPSRANQRWIFDSYLKYMESSERSARFFVDVKYTSWHNLNEYWYSAFERPELLHMVAERKIPVVHLKRTNLFALYCSQRLAKETGVWWGIEERKDANPRLVVNMGHCLPFMEGVRATERLFDRWLDGYPHAFRELRYEKLLASGEFTREVVQTFSKIYGIPPVSPLSTIYRKVAPPLRNVIENKDEVLSALRGTDFFSMAEEALS